MSIRLLCACVLLFAFGTSTFASDLSDVKARGVLRHIGIPYANFVTGSGDGMDVELARKFARYLGVRYEFVQSDWGTVVQDLIGNKVKVTNGIAELLEDAPIKGDMIANGFTMLPWRQQIVDFALPTFPNQIWLLARADSPTRPIKPTRNTEKDIALTKALMNGKTVLTMENTCLDPALYNLTETGAVVLCRSGNLNEMAPALLNREGDFTILDVPDALVALEKWKGQLKIIGPISGKQQMGVAFSKESHKLREAYNRFISKAQHDGTYLAIVKKYYPTAISYFPEFFKDMK